MSKYFARILATGAALPQNVVTNQDLAEKIDTSDEWIVTRTGIKQRHIISGDESNFSLALAAAKQALTRAELKAEEIDLIICATCTPDRYMPSSASYIQEALGTQAVAYDINAACSGFVYGLQNISQMMATGAFKNALLIGVDVASRLLDWEDRTTCVLFGDGAGAVVFTADKTPGILGVELSKERANTEILKVEQPVASNHPSFLSMAGREVFKRAVNSMDHYAVKALEHHGLSISDVDWLIPHQANWRIIKATMEKLKLPSEKAIVTVDQHANTVAASIPLALNFALEQQNKISRPDCV